MFFRDLSDIMVLYINNNEDGTMRILLVEDDKELCDAIKLQLERAGYETDCCGQGQEAFYYASEYPYDVIILDRMLPQMDGLGVQGSGDDDRCGNIHSP